MKKLTNIVIIGDGSIGLSFAYNLRVSLERIIILSRKTSGYKRVSYNLLGVSYENTLKFKLYNSFNVKNNSIVLICLKYQSYNDILKINGLNTASVIIDCSNVHQSTQWLQDRFQNSLIIKTLIYAQSNIVDGICYIYKSPISIQYIDNKSNSNAIEFIRLSFNNILFRYIPVKKEEFLKQQYKKMLTTLFSHHYYLFNNKIIDDISNIVDTLFINDSIHYRNKITNDVEKSVTSMNPRFKPSNIGNTHKNNEMDYIILHLLEICKDNVKCSEILLGIKNSINKT